MSVSDRYIRKSEFDTFVQNLARDSWRSSIAAVPEPLELFTLLFDTPMSYTGEAAKFVQVNAGEDALEFNLVTAEDVQPGTFPAGDFKYGGNVWLGNDGDELRLGDDNNDYTIQWDGNDAVHTVVAGDFTFVGGGLGIGVVPAQKFEIGSADNSNRISIYHDNTDAYFNIDDGVFIFQTTEAPPTNTVIRIEENGAAATVLQLMDQDGINQGNLWQQGGSTNLQSAAGDPLRLNHNNNQDVTFFESVAGGGETYVLFESV